MISTALIGVSGFARIHLQELLEASRRGRLRIAAATVINPEEEPEKCALLREHGARLFNDYEAMLDAAADDIDLVAIPTGIHLHAPMTIRSLRAGCHVLVEKPAAAILEDLEAMRTAARETGRLAAVAFQHIYAEAAQTIKRLILDGSIGRLERIGLIGFWPRTDRYWRRNGWAGRLRLDDGTPVYDAPFHNAFAHFLNLTAFFAGPTFGRSAIPTVAAARAWRVRPIESCDTVTAVGRFGDAGPRFDLHLSHACRKHRSPELALEGTGGRIVWDTGGSGAEITDAAGTRVLDVPLLSRQAMWDAVVDRIQGGDTLVCDLDIAGAQLVFAHRLFDALKTHTWADPESHNHEGDRLLVIPGVEAAFEAAYRSGTLADL